MASKTDIVNIALARLKQNLQITNLDTDFTSVGKLARLLYPLKLDELQSIRPWNFNKTTATLVQVAQNPTPVWAFSYAYPSDCLFLRRILSVIANSVGTLSFQQPSNAIIEMGTVYAPQMDNRQSVVPFEIVNGLIYTNQTNAQAEYTYRNTDEGTWPSSFVTAMSYALAADFAPTLTDGDPYGLTGKMMQLAQAALNSASQQDGNQAVQISPDAESIQQR